MCRLLPQAVSPRSKKFKGPGGLPLPSPVDPGHLLTKLNGDAAPKRCKRHEFSLDTCLGPTIFHRTKARHSHKSVVSAWWHSASNKIIALMCIAVCKTTPCLLACLLTYRHVSHKNCLNCLLLSHTSHTIAALCCAMLQHGCANPALCIDRVCCKLCAPCPDCVGKTGCRDTCPCNISHAITSSNTPHATMLDLLVLGLSYRAACLIASARLQAAKAV